MISLSVRNEGIPVFAKKQRSMRRNSSEICPKKPRYPDTSGYGAFSLIPLGGLEDERPNAHHSHAAFSYHV